MFITMIYKIVKGLHNRKALLVDTKYLFCMVAYLYESQSIFFAQSIPYPFPIILYDWVNERQSNHSHYPKIIVRMFIYNIGKLLFKNYKH